MNLKETAMELYETLETEEQKAKFLKVLDAFEEMLDELRR